MLAACIHLYFRDFHPHARILHRSTFDRRQASPLLVASVCSIGYMLMGTDHATERGLWIFYRLRRVIAATVRDDSQMLRNQDQAGLNLFLQSLPQWLLVGFRALYREATLHSAPGGHLESVHVAFIGTSRDFVFR